MRTLRTAYNWFLDFFRPALKEGVVVEKVINPGRSAYPIVIGGIPRFMPASAPYLNIKFESADGARRRRVTVSQETFERYDLGDKITFDN